MLTVMLVNAAADNGVRTLIPSNVHPYSAHDGDHMQCPSDGCGVELGGRKSSQRVVEAQTWSLLSFITFLAHLNDLIPRQPKRPVFDSSSIFANRVGVGRIFLSSPFILEIVAFPAMPRSSLSI